MPGLGILITVLVRAAGRRRGDQRDRPAHAAASAKSWLLRVPVFKTIYAPVKQLVAAFSPDNEYGFKRVVMVEDARRGLVLGFLTKEFTRRSRTAVPKR